MLLGGWEQKQFRSQLYLYCLWTLTCHSIKCEKREKLEVITLSAHHWRPPQTSPRIRQLTTWSKNWRQQTPEKIKRDAWIGLKLCWGRRWTFYTGLPRYTIFIIIIIIIIVIVIGCADRVSRGPFVVSGIITLTLGMNWPALALSFLLTSSEKYLTKFFSLFQWEKNGKRSSFCNLSSNRFKQAN